MRAQPGAGLMAPQRDKGKSSVTRRAMEGATLKLFPIFEYSRELKSDKYRPKDDQYICVSPSL